ncbi:hypothetical protein Tco_0178940 [Tanacetum coccineum]
MSITQAQQKALDDALVAPKDRLSYGIGNQRLSTAIKTKEPTLQVVLDALSPTPFLGHSTFIRDLGNSGEIKFLSDFNLDLLHQPWGALTTIINRCLSGKSCGVDNIRLSRAQILWGMFHKKNSAYVYLLWEDFIYQVENKESKTSKKSKNMFYPRFTKIIIDYFMNTDITISKRNMFYHRIEDDSVFTTMRCVSKHQPTQLYGKILPADLLNAAMKNSDAYKQYYAFAFGDQVPKPKYVRKIVDLDSTDVVEPVQASKGKRLKSKPKVSESPKKKTPTKDKVPKAKKLDVLSDVALTEAEQLKLVTERSRKEFHSTYATGSGAATETQSKAPEVPSYGPASEQETFGDSDDEEDKDVADIATKGEDDHDDHDDDDSNEEEDDDEESDNEDDTNEDTKSDRDENPDPNPHHKEKEEEEEDDTDLRVHTPSSVELTDAENQCTDGDEKFDKEEKFDDQQYNDEDDYDHFLTHDAEMLDATQQQPTQHPSSQETIYTREDAHVTITPVQQQSTSDSDLVSNFITPPPETGIDLIMNPNAQATSLVNVPILVAAEIPPFAVTTLPPPTVHQPHLHATTPASTTTTAPPPPLQHVDFASLFQFDTRVNNLEKAFSEFQQTNQFAFAISSILGIIDQYLANKMTKAVQKIIKEQVKMRVSDQMSKIMPNVENHVTEMIASNNYGDVVSLKRGRDDETNDQDPDLESNTEAKRRKRGKEPESTSPLRERTSKSTKSSTAGTHSSFDEFLDTPIGFSAFMMNRLNITELTPDLLNGPTFQLMKGTCKSSVELEYHFQEVFKATTDQLDWNNLENKPYPYDLSKPLPLITNEQGRQAVPLDHFINNDLAYLKGGSSTLKYTTSVTKTRAANYSNIKWIEDKAPRRQKFYGFATNKESKHDVYSRHRIIGVTSVKIMTWFGYDHLEEISKLSNLSVEERLALNTAVRMYTRRIVIRKREEDLQLGVESYRKKLNVTKPETSRYGITGKTLSDGTLNDVRSILHDIISNSQLEYLPKHQWSKSELRRARVMLNDIDRKLRDRQLMQSLERFRGGRPYRGVKVRKGTVSTEMELVLEQTRQGTSHEVSDFSMVAAAGQRKGSIHSHMLMLD